MSKAVAINTDSRALWRTLVRAAEWWNADKLYAYWKPCYTQTEVTAHLEALTRYGFLERHKRAGASHPEYAYTASCKPLLGEPAPPRVAPAPLASQASQAAVGAATQGRSARYETYRPERPCLRPGALDHTNAPSLLMGQRRPYRAPLSTVSVSPKGV